MSGCAEYCLRVVGLLWAVLGVPGAPSGRVWPVGSGGVASRGCIHTSKIVLQKVHPSLFAILHALVTHFCVIRNDVVSVSLPVCLTELLGSYAASGPR